MILRQLFRRGGDRRAGPPGLTPADEADREPDLRSASSDELRAWRDRIVGEALLHAGNDDLEAAASSLRKLESATIDDQTLDATDLLLPRLARGRQIVASLDPSRVPGPDEVVIIYGNYPHVFCNVVVNNPIKRHVADFGRFQHDRVESDARWDGVDRILVINVDGRKDRWDSVLRELTTAGAPLDRVTRVSAIEPPGKKNDQAARQLACLRSHTKALRIASDAGLGTVMVLEDDFCFTSDIGRHLSDLSAFLERGYDYFVCLIATSKYGAVLPVDDVVSQSFQECTNTGGYLISAPGRAQVIPIFEDADKKLKRTGDTLTYAVDRYWASLQPSGKFLVFRRKFGFQGANFSDIEQSVARYLD